MRTTDYEIRKVSIELLSEYVNLFRASFPAAKNFNLDYLSWLYLENPCGEVVGFDAFQGGTLAAHYVGVPVKYMIEGCSRLGLLSLNTATHPAHQGKGLFTRLAEATYDHAANNGYEFVIGVANANSTPGFVRKLGFELIGPLSARIGVGPISGYPDSIRGAVLHRDWDLVTLAWRAANPANRWLLLRSGLRKTTLIARTHMPGLNIEATIPGRFEMKKRAQLRHIGSGRLFLGLAPAGSQLRGISFELPDRFRKSPLNLIFRPLASTLPRVAADTVLFSALDFDAY